MAQANNPPIGPGQIPPMSTWIDFVGSGDDTNLDLVSRVIALNNFFAWGIINMGAHERLDVPFTKTPNYKTFESACHALMSGRLVTRFGEVYFVPDSAHERQARLRLDFLTSPVLDIETQNHLDIARRFLKMTRTGAPKFLFRGFNPFSGGGIDPKLNNAEGVTPHAYLEGGKMPTDMWDIPNLHYMITQHLKGDQSISSPFSSWTHCMSTALKFAGPLKDSRIAVLDTTSWRQNVHFSFDLWRAALSDEEYKDEYLIFGGPITGPNYHTVSVWDLWETTRLSDIYDGTANAFGGEHIAFIERGAVEASKEIATFLQPPGASLENILILTARFAGVRAARCQPGQGSLHSHGIHGFLYYIRDDLQTLAMRRDARKISLVEPTMDTSYCRDLVFEVQMQQAAEDAVRGLGWVVRTAMFKFVRPSLARYNCKPTRWSVQC